MVPFVNNYTCLEMYAVDQKMITFYANSYIIVTEFEILCEAKSFNNKMAHRDGQLLFRRGLRLKIFRSSGPHINLWPLNLGETYIYIQQ
jgi:hypothetical protein